MASDFLRNKANGRQSGESVSVNTSSAGKASSFLRNKASERRAVQAEYEETGEIPVSRVYTPEKTSRTAATAAEIAPLADAARSMSEASPAVPTRTALDYSKATGWQIYGDIQQKNAAEYVARRKAKADAEAAEEAARAAARQAQTVDNQRILSTSRPERYTEENIAAYASRARALSELPEWTDAQRAEAQEIYDIIRPSTLLNDAAGWWNDLRYSLTGNPELSPTVGKRVQPGGDLYDQFGETYYNLENKLHAGKTAAITGLMRGIGGTSVGDVLVKASEMFGDDYAEAARAEMDKLKGYESFSSQAAPAAYTAGNIAGNVILYTSLSRAVTSAVGAVASAPAISTALATPGAAAESGVRVAAGGFKTILDQVVRRSASAALTYAASDAIRSAGSLASGEMNGKTYLLEMGKGGATGLATGLASSLVSAGAAGIINKYRLTSPIAFFAKEMATGLAGSGTYTGISTLSATRSKASYDDYAALVRAYDKYATDEEVSQAYSVYEDNFSAELRKSAGQQFFIGFLTTMVQSAISTAQISAANKRYFDSIRKTFEAEQQRIVQELYGGPDSQGITDPIAREAYVREVVGNIDRLQQQLEEGFAGQSDFTYSVGEKQALREIWTMLQATKEYIASPQSVSAGAAADTADYSAADFDTSALLSAFSSVLSNPNLTPEAAVAEASAPAIPDTGALAGAAAAVPTFVPASVPAEAPAVDIHVVPTEQQPEYPDETISGAQARETSAQLPEQKPVQQTQIPATQAEEPRTQQPTQEDFSARIRTQLNEAVDSTDMDEGARGHLTEFAPENPGDVSDYYGEFAKHYEAGRSGAPLESVSPNDNAAITPEIRKIAYNDGKLAAIREETNVVQSDSQQQTVAEPPATKYTGITESTKKNIASAKTGQSFTAAMFNGKGKSAEEIYSGVQYPVAGKGTYYAFSEKQASNYGDNITSETVTLSNPIVIRDDNDWRALAKAAGWPYPNTFGLADEERIAYADAMREYVLSQGYDGIIVAYENDRYHDENDRTGNSVRVIDDLFGHDQAVVYGDDSVSTIKEDTPVVETPKPEYTESAETVEEAKAELKKAIRMPVKGTNAEALRVGAENGELSLDSVTMGGNVPGFTAEQRRSLATQIIQGVGKDGSSIRANVPGDGTFTIENTPAAAAKVLDKLNVKANQESIITKDIDKWLRGAGSVNVATVGGREYATDGYLAYYVGKDGADYITGESAYKAGRRGMEKNAPVLDRAAASPAITEQPVIAQSGKKTFYVFDTPDGKFAFEKPLLDKIDTGTLHIGIEIYSSGRKAPYIAAVNEDGGIAGFMIGKGAGDMEAGNYTRAKLKSIKNAVNGMGTAKEGTKNGERKAVAEVSDTAGVQQPAARGAGNGDVLDGLAPEDVQAPSGGGDESRGVLRPEGERVRGHAARPDGTGDGRGRRVGDREAGDLSAAGEVTKTAPAEQPEAEAHEVEVKSETALQEQPKGSNFVIPAAGLKLPSGEHARAKANIQAIKTLRTIMAEGRFATPAEQEILSKYVGWGGLANALDERKEDWSKEYKQIKALLTDQEFKTAKGSTLNAHYTEIGVIRGIYAGLEKLGFTGGRLLEPSAGIGHFVGAMPEHLLPGVKSWTMVELDSITGNIAKYLYPNADVRVQGFEYANIPNDYMDMAISNVPFGNYGIADKSYPKEVTGSIHNYFFAKSLDKVRPGGLVVFITSRYTMDSNDSAVRRYIMKRSDLLGAIRLPDTAFKGNAGTEVVTDILVLKKREPNTPYKGEAFESTDYYYRSSGIYEATNEYFDTHPEMLLGEPSKTGTMYGRSSLTFTPKDTKTSLQKQIEKAFSKITGKMDYPTRETPEQAHRQARQAEEKGKNGSIVKRDGKLYKVQDGELTESGVSEKDTARMEAVIGIRDAARALLDAQLAGKGTGEIKILRHNLNVLYDAFVKENGPLHKQANARLIKMDVDHPFILALENYNKDSKTASKATIFTQNTVTPNVSVTHVNTVEEGLIVSMNETGGVNAARIAQLVGESRETVTRRLLDTGLAFLDRDGNLVLAESYLSGNVKAKLRDAEALAEMNPEYKRNVEALKKVVPADVPAEEISVRPGVTWIPTATYGDFAAEMLGTSNRGYRPAVEVTYSAQTGQYNIKLNQSWLKTRPENTSEWGTPDRSFVQILTATLNNRSITVWRKTPDGGRILDKQATAAAQEKQEKILAEFQKWIWKDEGRKAELQTLYNDVFNNSVTPKYDGSSLTVNGSSAQKPLRPHQKDVVWRVVASGGNTLIAHRVGAGKTYEMAASAMKLRQLGIVRKPVFVVPKSLVAQWGNEFLDFFPAAKVLVLDEKSFTAQNRKEFANRIATGDWDAVIMSQEQFKAVPMSFESQEAFYQEQIDQLEMALIEAAMRSGKNDPSVKQLEKAKKSLEVKLRRLTDMKKDADNIDFEALGVDSLFVDEAHSYKNLFYTTNMNNVSGLGNKNGSQKAFDLYMKVRYLQRLNGGKGVVFATATPVMNSMSEMYIMQKYLQGDLLDARGLTSFDAWANQFGEVRTVLEMNPSGKGFRQKQSFSRFKNLAELQQMFRSFADVLTDVPGLKIPTMKTGKRIIVESEPSDFQMQYIERLAERADAIKNGRVDPHEDNMLKITSEGRKLSYTQRMIDPSLPYEAGNKVMKCVQNVYDLWKSTADTKGTQLIFCDLSTPKGGAATETDSTEGDTEAPEAEDISIYDDIKSMLVAQGVPAKEIAFIHDADTNEKKAKLFEDVNEGRVRVLIGSTGKMGVGMNAQKRVVALHHLDAPWRPGDIEQREGRALRQGNMNDEVSVYVYVTKKTFDSRMWDNLQRKASFIHQVMAGDLTARESEGDGDFALSAAEIKAISSGNPLIMEQFEVAAQLTKLETLERAHNKEVADAEQRIQKTRQQIASDEETEKKLRKDAAAREDTSGDNFTIQLGGKTVSDRKTAGEAIIAEAKKRLKIDRNEESVFKIGSFAGFDLYVTNGGEMLLRGAMQYRATVNMQSAPGTVQALEGMVKRIDTMMAATQKRIEEGKAAIKKLEQTAAAPFDRADELSAARRRNAEIMAELNPDEDTGTGFDEDEDSEFIDMPSMSTASTSTANPEIETEVVEAEAAQTEKVSYSRDTKASETGLSAHPEWWTAERVGDKSKKPMSISEIVEMIRHDWGINITTGHIRKSGVRGQYSELTHGIRTRIANDLPTIAHELGHRLDDLYGIIENVPAAAKKELVDNLDPAFAALYKDKDKQLPAEGVAEFLRRFLQNRETAAIDYPEFTKYFLNSLSGPDQANIEQLADEVNAYYSLDATDAQSSIRNLEEKLPDARTPTEKIKAKCANFYQAWGDSNHGIKRFDDATGANAYKLATNAAYADNVAANLITGDLYDAHGAYVAPGLKSCFAGHEEYLTDKVLYRTLGEYLVVKHGPERLAEGMGSFSDDRKNSTAWMNRRQMELEAEHPEFVEISDRLYAFQKQLLQTWGVETGLISAESAEAWGERWKYYVPFNRAVGMEQREIGAKSGFANQENPYKKARGSGLDFINPVDNIIRNIVLMVNAGLRNNVMLRIADSAKRVGDALYLEQVPASVAKKSFDMTGVKAGLKKAVDDSTITDATEVYGIIDNLPDILEQYGRGKAYGDVVTVMRNGNPEYWKVNDPLLLQSITNMNPKKMDGVLDAYAVVSRFMTGNITGNNLLWSIFSNLPRDLMTFFTFLPGSKNPAKAFSAMGSAYANKLKGDHADPLYKEFLSMGGNGGFSAYTADRDVARRAREKLAGKNISANPLDWISFASDMIEMGPRYATYKLMRDNGMSPEEAFYEAMDVTVNFRRGGRYSRELNKFVPFFNAGVQGLDKFARWLTAQDAPKEGRAKVSRGRFIGWIAASAALAAIFHIINNARKEDKKNYQQLSNYTKNSYWVIPIGDGKYFAVPKPREIAVLSSFFETCMERANGNEYAFDEFYDYVTDTVLPNVVSDLAKGDVAGAAGSLGLLGVVTNMTANRDFLGKPIVSAGLQYLEPKDQYTARTSMLAYAIGQAFNVSPQKVDYFFQNTLGGWWKVPTALFPVGRENVDLTLGVQGSYIKDNQYSTDIVNRLYDLKGKSDAAHKSNPTDMDKAITAKLDDNMTTFYSRYNTLSKNAGSTASRGTRQEVLDMILEYEKSRDAGAATPAERAVYSIARKRGDVGPYLPSVMQNTVTDGNGTKRLLSDVEYVEFQTDYLRIYWETVEDSLPSANNDAERAAIIRAAKDVAKEQAVLRTLRRNGWDNGTDYSNKYGNVNDRYVAAFKGYIDIANDDGSLKQNEVIEAIRRLQSQGLSNNGAYTLFHSRYDSDKNNPWAK